MSVNRNVHELSDHEISAVHGGSMGIPLTTNYQTMFYKFVLDIDKNLGHPKSDYLMSPDSFSGFHHLR